MVERTRIARVELAPGHHAGWHRHPWPHRIHPFLHLADRVAANAYPAKIDALVDSPSTPGGYSLARAVRMSVAR